MLQIISILTLQKEFTKHLIIPFLQVCRSSNLIPIGKWKQLHCNPTNTEKRQYRWLRAYNHILTMYRENTERSVGKFWLWWEAHQTGDVSTCGLPKETYAEHGKPWTGLYFDARYSHHEREGRTVPLNCIHKSMSRTDTLNKLRLKWDSCWQPEPAEMWSSITSKE